jgi:hypothetical protein
MATTKKIKPPAKPSKAPPKPSKAPAKKPTSGKPTKAPAKKPPSAPAPSAAELAALKAVSSPVGFQVQILQVAGVQTVGSQTPVPQGRWFAAVPTTPSPRRYHFLLQFEGSTHHFALYSVVDGAGAPRLPPAPGYQRALFTGPVHVISSDRVLTRPEIAAIVGGHEPPSGLAKPPAT